MRNVRSFLLVLLLGCFLLGSSAFALERQPNATYRARRDALAAKLDGHVAILFAAEEPLLDFMAYRQDSDFYYLTGWNEPGAALMVAAATPADATHAAAPAREILFLPARNPRTELFTGAKLDARSPEATTLTGVAEVKPMTEMPAVLAELGQRGPRVLRQVWIQEDVEQAKQALGWAATALTWGQPPAINDVRSLTMELRSVKDPGEIALLRKAGNASMVAQRAAVQAIRPQVNERAIAGLLIGTVMAQGCERPSYAPIVGSGKNSTVLHYSDDGATMEAGDVVVMDAAGEYSMYASDITRTVPVNGHFTDRQREIYNIVLGAQQAAAAAFVVGKSRINDFYRKYPDSLDSIAWNYINTHGKDLHGQPLGKYVIHGLGHSVGIDVHDPYNYAQPLQKNAVFTIEPGIYIPEEKLGVRIEDVFYVDDNGKLQDFNADLPHTAEDIEALMKQHTTAECALGRAASPADASSPVR
jgi:Xaa-Pro aminopeptidase